MRYYRKIIYYLCFAVHIAGILTRGAKMPRLPFFATVFMVQVFVAPVFSAVKTVARDGTAQYTSIQAAIDDASPYDEIVIKDAGVYSEQVTIDSSRNGLVLRSEVPTSATKPLIKWRDEVNVGPKTFEESEIDSLITFQDNGALRILGAANVRIDGVAISGEEPYAFGHDNIWDNQFALQHGNGAVCLHRASNTIIRNCDISNGYFGIIVTDGNEAAIFAFPNPSDRNYDIINYSGTARSGNHLFEHNRIHDNSFGFYFESSWDLGSTIRYNLIYENHHYDNDFATTVRSLTIEGYNHTGGAFMFKDDILSPLAIHNNTLRHNSLLFCGNWKPGPVHLVFNNIFSAPNDYWELQNLISNGLDMTHMFRNRLYNSVIAAQHHESTDISGIITNNITMDGKYLNDVYPQGTPLSPFPETAEVRWVETPFKSTDPASVDFLVPKWDDPKVVEYIIDKGWDDCGIKDPDGTRADLGAIAQNSDMPADLFMARPATPAMFPIPEDGTMKMDLTVVPRIGTVSDLHLSMLRLIKNIDTADCFGAEGDSIKALNIVQLPAGSQTMQPGANSLSPQITGSVGAFAFFETVITGTGSDGKAVSAIGFVPYRDIEDELEVSILDKRTGETLDTVTAGDTVVLHVRAHRAGVEYSGNIDETRISLYSFGRVVSPGNRDSTIVDFPDGISATASLDIVFEQAPSNGCPEYVSVAGVSWDENRGYNFYGASGAIVVRDDPASVRRPAAASVNPALQGGAFKYELIDLHGRVIQREFGSRSVSTASHPFAKRDIGRGLYLVRSTNITTGAATTHRLLRVRR